MQYAITDDAAIELSRAFYEALADGLPVDAAVAEARKAISIKIRNTLEWGTPVLYMRSPDGVLFDFHSKRYNKSSNTTIKTSIQSSLSIEEQVSLWLDVIASNKQRTREQYELHITQFRNVLHKYGFDLNSEDGQVISSLVEQWAKSGTIVKEVADATFNQRLSSVRSFYTFACEHHWLRTNPIASVKRRKDKRNEPDYAGNILDPETITDIITRGLKSIDRKTLLGKRDYAILSILFTTLRRVSEVNNLKCGDISIRGNSVTVTWRRFKSSKDKYTTLSPDISRALIEYLEEAYGNNRPNDAPLWLSFSRFNRGDEIGVQAIAAACEKYLKTSRVEMIRQTLMVLGEREGTKEVEKRLNIN